VTEASAPFKSVHDKAQLLSFTCEENSKVRYENTCYICI